MYASLYVIVSLVVAGAVALGLTTVASDEGGVTLRERAAYLVVGLAAGAVWLALLLAAGALWLIRDHSAVSDGPRE